MGKEGATPLTYIISKSMKINLLLFAFSMAVVSLSAQETVDESLARHDFFYAGQSKQRRMFFVKEGRVAWSYDDLLKKGEISDAVLMADGHILVAHQYGVAEIDADGRRRKDLLPPTNGRRSHRAPRQGEG